MAVIVQQQQYMGPQPPPTTVIIQNLPPVQQQYENYNANQARTSAIIQLVVSALTFVFNIVSIVVSPWGGGFCGVGFWCIIFYSIAGGIGVGSASSKSPGLVKAYFGLSITAAVFAVPHIACSITPLYFGSSVLTAMTAIMLLLGLLEMCVAIWASVISGRVVCGPTQPTGVQGQIIQPGFTQQAVVGQTAYQQPQMYQQPMGQQFSPQQPMAQQYQPQQPMAYQQPQQPMGQQYQAPPPQQQYPAAYQQPVGGAPMAQAGAPPSYEESARPPQFNPNEVKN